jgi:hypothetical protein
MARVFVFSDNLTARIEIVKDPVNGWFMAYCAGCSRGTAEPVDLTAETNTVTEEDATEIAGPHADRCTRCADPDCRTQARHDAGHRCRKD